MKTLVLSLLIASTAAPTPGKTPPLSDQVARIAHEVLKDSGVPSASIAIVQNGSLVFTGAFGDARLAPRTAAKPAMRYAIGSISKQFTATGILLLVEQGKISLDDPIAKYLPAVAHANEVTVRQILAQVSGYPDYWPQDYVPPAMLEPISHEGILTKWTPTLDFKPGTKWEYSNTNYVLAGMILEKVSGEPLMQFLEEHIFKPLGMTSVVDVDAGPLGAEDSAGYFRYALGPPRPAPKEGKGWLFAMGGLAMTAEDLAKWDLSVMKQSVLKPASYAQLERPYLLPDGDATRYGLGIGVARVDDRRVLTHDGEVSGFTADNVVYPEDGAAIVVLTNQDAASTATDEIGSKLRKLLFPQVEEKTDLAKQIYEGLQHGKIDRSLFSANANGYFSAQALKDFASSLGPLGPPKKFEQTAKRNRGGMVYRSFKVSHGKRDVKIVSYMLPDGKFEQFMVMPE